MKIVAKGKMPGIHQSVSLRGVPKAFGTTRQSPGMLPFARAVCISFLLLAGCATVYNPVTRREERTLYTVEQEIELGKQVAEQIEKENEICEDKADYVNRVGQLVASNSDRDDIAYSFKIIDSGEINAFALPGGFIYIYKGLLDIIEEPELAAVLGHEIGHVAARHGIKRVQAVFGYQLLAIVALVALGDKPEAGQIQQIANDIFTLVILGYSREDEFQADRLGTIYAHRGGYDPRGMVRLLEKLGEQSRGQPITFLSTHPPIEDRISQVEIVISALESEESR